MFLTPPIEPEAKPPILFLVPPTTATYCPLSILFPRPEIVTDASEFKIVLLEPPIILE